MFVASLLADWGRKLERLGAGDHNHNESMTGEDCSTYEDFLEHQKMIWTPSELYEKCCPRFLAGDVSRKNKNGHFVCGGGCRKVHPTITLYFDAYKACTVAALSYRLDPFIAYLDERVNDGSAVSKSPFYYELDGFLRENLHRLRNQQRFFGGHLVEVAIGALKESDAAQTSRLEEVHRQQHLQRHCIPNHPDSLHTVMHTFDNFAETRPPSFEDMGKLEVVLEICRLWGLGETLDILSIECMLRTSRVFRMIATPMARQRVRECKFVVTPLVDGHCVSGYSVFRRADSNKKTILERERGRLVEYAVWPSVLYCEKENGNTDYSEKTTNQNDMAGRFFPTFRSNDTFDRNYNTDDTFDTGFSWDCEELSFANLELACMDIGLQEYIGQKVIVQWRRGDVDIPVRGYNVETEEPNDVPVFRLELDWAPQKKGIVNLSLPHFGLKLDIPRNSVLQVDDVTFSYQGNAKVLECKADFAFLVAAYARSLEACLISHHKDIELTRPLLRHEEEFLKDVRRAASLCPVSRFICK